MNKDKQTIDELVKARLHDHTLKPKREVILTLREIIVGCLGSYVLYTGLPKASKSTYIAATVASAFNTFEIFHIKLTPPKERPIVLYVDTESNEYDYYYQVEKILFQMGRKSIPNDLKLIGCREDNKEDIMEIIEGYIKHYPTCSVVVVDGLLDLVNNYNDEKEGKSLVNWLKRITKRYNILLIAVLHTSRTAGSAIGHIGATSERYCQSSLEIKEEESTEQYVLKPKLLRSAKRWKFEPIAISCINDKWLQVDYIEPDAILPKPRTKAK